MKFKEKISQIAKLFKKKDRLLNKIYLYEYKNGKFKEIVKWKNYLNILIH